MFWQLYILYFVIYIYIKLYTRTTQNIKNEHREKKEFTISIEHKYHTHKGREIVIYIMLIA